MLLEMVLQTRKLPRDVGARDLGELRHLDPETFEFLQTGLTYRFRELSRRKGSKVGNNTVDGSSADHVGRFGQFARLLKARHAQSVPESEQENPDSSG